MESRPNPARPAEIDPEARTRRLVRENRWLTRFWMELTPAQQARVEQRLRRGGGGVQIATTPPADPSAIWDPMGLTDRVRLVFGDGGGPPPERPVSAGSRDGSVWAGSSLTGTAPSAPAQEGVP